MFPSTSLSPSISSPSLRSCRAGTFSDTVRPFLPIVWDSSPGRLISSHEVWLARHGDRVCLITDIERREDHADGRRVVADLLDGAHLSEPEETWTWFIAPQGKVFRDRAVRHHVAAWRDYRSVSR